MQRNGKIGCEAASDCPRLSTAIFEICKIGIFYQGECILKSYPLLF